LLALTGTPVHVLIVEASRDAGAGGFGYFDFALIGVPVLLATIALVVVLGPRLLPQRTPQALPPDLSEHARTLVEQYRLQGDAIRLRVREGSPWVGEPHDGLDLAAAHGVSLVAAERGGRALPPGSAIAAGDQVVVRGEPDAVAALAGAYDLAIRSEGAPSDLADALVNRTSGVAEVMIPPRSALIDRDVFPGMVTPAGDLIILAVSRGDERLGRTTLAAGDTLLIQGTWAALDERLQHPDVLVVDAPEVVRRQAVPLGPRSLEAIGVMLAMVVLLATGIVPPVVAGLLAALAMIVLRVVSMQGAYRAINWTTVVLVAAMIPLSTAMVQSGAADAIAARLVDLVGGMGPYALLAGLFAITAVFGQLISNMATALIVIPIGVAAAAGLDVSVQPVLMSITVAAAAALLTPVATPVNLMVMGPGGYRFGDYWKLGSPILVAFFVGSVFLVPLFWPF
jgi:di/tricarboxylate transporter